MVLCNTLPVFSKYYPIAKYDWFRYNLYKNPTNGVSGLASNEICFFGKHTAKKNIFIPHRHDFYEVIYFLKGKGKQVIGNHEYEVHPHRYCVVPPNVDHVEKLDADGEILFVGFKLDNGVLSDSVSIQQDEAARALPLLESVLREYRDQKTGYKEAAAAYLQIFLVGLLRENTRENKECRDLHYVKTYLEQYYGQKINFRELSALTGYSYDYFRHIFKVAYGISPQDYLINVRLEQAKSMLHNTALSCTQIAISCGFSNSGQMSVMIKRRYGKSPLALRKAD